MATKILRNKNSFIVFDDSLENVNEDVFDFYNKNQEKEIIRKGAGRGTVLLFRHGSMELVHKSYRRGGLAGKIVSDKYLWTGLNKTRSFKEFFALKNMREEDLPVPRPIAARVIRHIYYYRAELITEKIDNANTLGEHLEKGTITTEIAKDTGTAIRSFHNHGFKHPDLNVENIVITNGGKIFLLDFDKAKPRKKKIQDSSDINRLRRSITKVSIKKGKVFPSQAWKKLTEAYAIPK
ncbi:MAG: 3-deoxy-D-manno-octulosonic acid kinase [Gammaproteobacteria bacterium]|nr:3-deoxy-D-manno-octulosonic acid kinase [Gammaproteobacteria bacterium]